MSNSGPAYFARKLYADPPILDGTQFGAIFDSIERAPVYASVFSLQMGDGRGIVQSVARGVDDPENPVGWQWTITEQATTEADWLLVTATQSRARVVDWIPYEYETETYLLAAGARTITLRRPTAVSVYPTFSQVTYPDQVLIDGVAQTIVGTGTPASGEVRLEGSELEVPSDTAAGAVLVLRYYPAYRVFLPVSGISLSAWNSVSRSVTLVEVQE